MFNFTPTLVFIESQIGANGYFPRVRIGEPKGPVDDLTAAIWMQGGAVKQATLQSPIEVHTAKIRTYINMLHEPTEEIETILANGAGKIIGDLCSNLQLDNQPRCVDVAGIYGQSIAVNWGYCEISGTLYRVADIIVPIIVDDDATFAN